MSTTFRTVHDLAGELHCSPRTVQRWARERRIPHVRLGRSILFTQEQVEEIAEAYTIAPSEPAPDVSIPNPHYSPRGAVVVPMRKPA